MRKFKRRAHPDRLTVVVDSPMGWLAYCEWQDDASRDVVKFTYEGDTFELVLRRVKRSHRSGSLIANGSVGPGAPALARPASRAATAAPRSPTLARGSATSEPRCNES